MADHLTNQTTDTTSTPELCENAVPKTAFITGTLGNAVIYAETASASDAPESEWLNDAEFRGPARKVFTFDGYLRLRQAGSSSETNITGKTRPV